MNMKEKIISLEEVLEHDKKLINLFKWTRYKTLDSIISLIKNDPETFMKIRNMGVARASRIIDYINKNTKEVLNKEDIMDKIYSSKIKINNIKKSEKRKEMLKRLKDKYGITKK